MKIAVRIKWPDGEDIRYTVALPEEFNCYKPAFLQEHFSRFIMSAVIDLRIPEYVPFAVQLDKNFFKLKTDILPKLSNVPDKEELQKIMREIKLGFIRPRGNKDKG